MNGFDSNESAISAPELKQDDTFQKQKQSSQQTKLELRKKKFDELMAKNRNIDDITASSQPEAANLNPIQFQPTEKPSVSNSELKYVLENLTIENMNSLAVQMTSMNENTMFEAVQGIRKLLSSNGMIKICHTENLNTIIKSNYLPFIIDLLRSFPQNETLRYEICWTLTNIAAGTSEHTTQVVESGGLDTLLNLISIEPSMLVKDQILWALSNIIGDGKDLRNRAVKLGILDRVKELIFNPQITSISIKHNIAWIISNILRPADDFLPAHLMDTIYMMLEKLIHDHSDQSEIIFDVSWALNYCQNDPSQRHIIFERGFHVFLAKHVRNGIVKNSKAALKALVVLSLAENSDIQKLIDTNIFDLCQELFEFDEEFFKKESILILGNIALGEISQKVALIQHSVFEKILMQISKLSKLCAYEAFFLITHIVNTNNIDFLKMLFRAYPQILTVFMNSISDKTTDYTLIERQLDAVNLLLLMQKPLEVDISLMAEEIGVVDVLEALQYHESIKIYEMAGRIIEDHFSMDDNVENAQKFMELQSKMNEDSESRFNF